MVGCQILDFNFSKTTPKIVVEHQLFFFWLPIGFVSTLQHAVNFVSYDGLNRSGQIINATDVPRLEQGL